HRACLSPPPPSLLPAIETVFLSLFFSFSSSSSSSSSSLPSINPSELAMRVLINAEEQEFSFGSNLIITSKYTLLSFLPLFLFASFHPKRKMANLYFLLLSIFQCVPQISNTYGVPTILLPLSFVIFVDAVFAALEFHSRSWVDIQVGDFLKIQNREVVPSDLILLAVHEPDAAQPDGICYLETKSLDGETNLKLR
ncbi:hypothetical protein VYU27_010455, partial [Nannochloropsis oceanica]